MPSERDDLKPIEVSLAHYVAKERDTDYGWRTMIGEWVDNSFGAGATRVTFSREGSTVRINDNGRGCDDVYNMVNIGQSFRAEGNRASRYGVGGKLSQISATKAGRVEIETVTASKMETLIVDWGNVIKSGDPRPSYYKKAPRDPGCRRGTTITLYGCRRWYDVPKIIRDLGYDYALELKGGKRIEIGAADAEARVKPYEGPETSRRVDFAFDLDGHPISGFCGLVKQGLANPYNGWTFHWGYRVLCRSSEPADGRATNRLYGEVNLPESWANHSPTKNGFAERPDALFDAVAERCREVIEAAESEAYEFELSTASREAEAIIGDVLRDAARGRVKGRRPGDAGKQGTVDPDDEGTPHRRFTHTQPGDKADADESGLDAKLPDRIRITWDDTIEGVYRVDDGGRRSKVLALTLNGSIPLLASLKADSRHLAAQCLTIIAYEVSIHRDRFRPMLPAFADEDFQGALGKLMSRAALPADSLTA